MTDRTYREKEKVRGGKSEGEKVECIYVVAPSTVANGREKLWSALSLKSRWKSLTTLNCVAEHYHARRGSMDFRI